MIEKGKKSRAALLEMAKAEPQLRDLALNEISRLLLSEGDEIRQAYGKDNLYKLEPLNIIVKKIFKIIELPNLVGDIFDSHEQSDGLKSAKMYVPRGVIGLVYDGDPLIVFEMALLALKSGNCVIVYADATSEIACRAWLKIVRLGLEAIDLPIDVIQVVNPKDEMSLKEFLDFGQGLDLILVRGSEKVSSYCRQNSFEFFDDDRMGVSHLYVDAYVDIEKTLKVILDSKNQPGRTIGTLLVNDLVAASILPQVMKAFYAERFSFRLDSKSWNLFTSLFSDDDTQMASELDWSMDRSKVLNIKIIGSLDEAIEHISIYGKRESEGILSENPLHAMIFAGQVAAHAILINTSIKCWDGNYYNRSHLLDVNHSIKMEDLLSYKVVIQGNYHVRS